MANFSFFLLLLIAIFLICSECMQTVHGADTSGTLTNGFVDRAAEAVNGKS
uniref:Uncharacterized protein n=1 Tax=Anopheles quadriannulatus TaxID=34691 RepID=A0A182XTF9_ANOQN